MRHRMWLLVLSGATTGATTAAMTAVVTAVVTAALPSRALAQPAGAASPPASGSAAEENETEDVDEESPPAPRPLASDKLTNHILLHGKVGVAFPMGSVAEDLPLSDLTGPGLTVGGGLGLGLSRYLSLEASATYGMLSKQEGCSACKSTSFDLSLGLAYHAVQGLAIDPWLSYGIGFRLATFTGASIAAGQPPLPDKAFQGLDLARIALGADFFPLPWVGLGPYFELAAGRTISRPNPDLGAALYTFFQMGVRLELDPIGRRGAPANAPVDVGRNRTSAPTAAASGNAPRTSGVPAERSLPWSHF